MLRISRLGFRLVSQGYHFNERGKKFIRVFASLCELKIQIKIEPHKEMHIRSISVDFPYIITNNWVEITVDYQDIPKDYVGIETYVNDRCNEIWFV